jgi:adenylosuccinate lyase
MFDHPMSRYTSSQMQEFFSPYTKAKCWRELWIALAEGEQALGLPITNEQIAELKTQKLCFDWDAIKRHEERTHHDVMAHILAYAELCPLGGKILHLGATSTFVTDNGDLLQIKIALTHLSKKMVTVMQLLHDFSLQHADLPCVGYTHFQVAQPVTLGKRGALWLQDLMTDLEAFENFLQNLKFFGLKGATGSQASFLQLFDNNPTKVDELEERVARAVGFDQIFPLGGQTYTRKLDIQLLSILSSFASSAHKFALDIRLLSHTEELREEKSPDQIGSSAMPYKRNPILSERLCGLARFVMCLHANALHTHAQQFLERSLDDSSNRRLLFVEAFFGVDAILNLYGVIVQGLVVDKDHIAAVLKKNQPYWATEALLMAAVAKGEDRQRVHEVLRKHSLALSSGGDLATFAKELSTAGIGLSLAEINNFMEQVVNTGLCSSQVDSFLSQKVAPVLLSHTDRVPLSDVI